MYLTWLELTNFRPYASLRFEPDEGINILVGDNGAGKTSVLEAIGYLGMMRSFRGVPDSALIRSGSDDAVVRGSISGAASDIQVAYQLPTTGRRTVLLNDKRPKRLSDVLLSVPIVAFVPDDLDVIKRGPAIRRDYLDGLSSQLWPQAGQDSAELQRIVRQRNALLKQQGRSADPVTLDVWDEKLAEAGARLMVHRRAVASALQTYLQDAYLTVGGSGDIGWAYRSTWGSHDANGYDELFGAFRDALAASRTKDMDVRTTTVGPHRDDPSLVLDGRHMRTQASQGEQRTAALALRVAAYRVIEEIRDHKPILLLDDVFSELDIDRARRVVELFEEGQVFVTTARQDEVPISGRRWSVEHGSIS